MLEDLQAHSKNKPLTLDVQDQQKYFEGREADALHGMDEKVTKSLIVPSYQSLTRSSIQDAEAAVQSVKTGISAWTPQLGNVSNAFSGRGVLSSDSSFLLQFQPEEKANSQAMTSILDNLQARAQAKSSKNTTFPSDLTKSISSFVTTSNEFLRQFWFAVLPPQSGDISFAARMSPEEKAAKAQRMISYLSRTEERVQALAKQAAALGIKEDKVRAVSCCHLQFSFYCTGLFVTYIIGCDANYQRCQPCQSSLQQSNGSTLMNRVLLRH